MIKAIFFDSGNVLIKEGFTSSIAEYEQLHNIPKGQLYASAHDRDFWKEFTLGNISEKEYFADVAKDFLQNLNLKELINIIYQSFIPNLELLDYIKTLKHKYILGVISNNPKEWFDYSWKGLNWEQIFSIRAVSGYLHLRKPDVKIFKIALSEAGVRAEEAIYVDDRPDRVGGAQEVGMGIVIYKNIERLKKDLNDLEQKINK